MIGRALLAALSIFVARVATAQTSAPLELVRCAAGSDVPCVRVRVTLDAAERAAAAQYDSAQERGAWSGTLAGNPLVGPGLAQSRMAVLPTRLLILIDRGAAMSGEGIAFTRIALKSWLAALDSSAVRVAIRGFDGKDLAKQIASANFQSPRATLIALDAVPSPSANGRSPLYSAVMLGAQHVAAARDSSPGTVGGLLVVTMGRNDIGRGKEAADLLTGAAGLTRASAGVSAANQRTWIVALAANAPLEELGALAGPGGFAGVIALDPNAIANRLAAIAREFIGVRELTFGVGAIGTAALGRTAVTGAARVQAGDHRTVVATLAWRPPLIAMPTFHGVAEPTALSPALREALLLGVAGGSNRPIVALLMAVLVIGIWMFTQRIAWRDLAVAPRPSRERSTTTRTSTVGAATEEGPPRKPEDITHQTARRTALRR